MNKLLITVLLITSAAIFSQELDDAYLESLPDKRENRRPDAAF